MPPLRYRIVEELPEEVQTGAFCDLDDRQIRVRVAVRGDELVVIGTGVDAAVVEALLARLGLSEVGVDLCG
ncbi:MAG: hypothetical protein HYU66_21440 [Armatimonadetes bacterium]|nr:hypothetical protein [Armatimonadota bacterium]